MKTLTLDERLRRLGDEIAAAQDRARHREDLGVGDILKDLNEDVENLRNDDHDGIAHAERRLEDVHHRLDTPPCKSDDE